MDSKTVAMAGRRREIFVSYTMRDGCLDSRKLSVVAERLRELGSPYVDLFDNRGLEPQRYVFRMLKRAELLVACVTPGYFQSQWVQVEIAFARRHEIPILPVVMPWAYRPNASHRRELASALYCPVTSTGRDHSGSGTDFETDDAIGPSGSLRVAVTTREVTGAM